MEKYGWIGLGAMGTVMARRLVEADHEVHVYNRSVEKSAALTVRGAVVEVSPAAVGRATDVVFLMLTDGAAVRDVLTQAGGLLEGLKPGGLVVDMSTISPGESETFRQLAEKGGVQYIDTPVSGSVGAAQSGQLFLLAGASETVVERLRPAFSVLGRQTFVLGTVGRGTSAKLAINLLLGLMGQSYAEVLLAADHLGLGREFLAQFIDQSAFNSGIFQAKREMFLSETFPPAFRLDLMAKDLGLIWNEAALWRHHIPLAGTSMASYQAARATPVATQDMAAIYLALKGAQAPQGDFMNAIQWPQGYDPGETDNFVSNEVILQGLSLADVWTNLVTPDRWPGYYPNATEIHFYHGAGPELRQGTRFRFKTFVFIVESECTEYVVPSAGQPGRVAWHGWCGEGTSRLDVHHAWLIEELPGGRVRILTQETQIGQDARNMAVERPNPMLNAHQLWLDGLVKVSRKG